METRNLFDETSPQGVPRQEAPLRRVALVFNSQSGSGDVDAGALASRMCRAGADIASVDIIRRYADIRRLVEAAAERADVVVVGGGDGTISASLPVFLETNRALGVLPLGTANDLARTLGIPPDPWQAADIVSTGTRRRIDLGEINGRPFCNAISLGFPVEVAACQSPEWKRRFGIFSYLLACGRSAWSFRPFGVEIHSDTERTRLDRLFSLTVMNGRYHGGGLAVDENSQIDDGVLKIYGVKAVSRSKLVRTFLSLKLGKLRRDSDTTLFKAHQVDISGDRPRRVNVDGDVLEKTPAHVRLLPAAIDVIVPRSDGVTA